MIEVIALFLIALAELGFLFWYVKESKKQQDKLINAIIAKNSQDQANLDLIDKLPVSKEAKTAEPDLVETGNLPDEEAIAKIIGKEIV